MRVSTRKIEESIIIIDGKKVRYQKIPTGMSGLDAQTKANLELKESMLIDDETEDNEFNSLEVSSKSNAKSEMQLNSYYDSGDIQNEEIEDYVATNMKPSSYFTSLFDELK